MKKNQSFSLRARGRSFKYAFNGLREFLGGQHNAWIHLVATTFVFLLTIAIPVSTSEMITLILATGFVWVAELFNTAIEKLMDFISEKQDNRIKVIKDISAGAVLLAATTALIVGCIVFIPKL